MNKTFLSHASDDRAVTLEILAALENAGIDAWVSFRDIAPGSHWDESIEEALKVSSAVVVVVTASSVESRYVRAEVETAINANKTVIPIIVDEVDVPLRWRTLQHVRWHADNTEACVSAISTALPESSVSKLSSALETESQFENVKKLLLTHPEWFPMESHMAKWYSFRIEPEITANSTVDCFAARLDTPGPRAILVYLTSPYERPFSASGGARPHMRKLMSRIRLHTEFLKRDILSSHPLAPPTLFASEAKGWKQIIPRYTSFRTYVLAGRRSHYVGSALSARNSFVAKANADLFPNDHHRSALEVLSYDRLIEGAQVANARPSGA